MFSKPKGKSLAAFLGYLAVSMAFFGLPVFGDPAHFFIADGSSPRGFADGTAMMWFLTWWPHALLHRLNPFLTNMVFAPRGVNLAWTTSIPGISLLASPVTLIAGPVIAYNLLCVLAPALAAWTAYLLCACITRNFWSSLFGGYLFGFSSYEAYHMPGHLSLTFVFVTPLLIYLVLLRQDDKIRPRNFVLLFGLALILQFLISNEVFATTTVFGAMALLIAFLVFPSHVRNRLLCTVGWIACAYILAVVVLIPYLYYIFLGVRQTPSSDPSSYSSDLLNFFLPTGLTFIGHNDFADVTRLFKGESSAYIGLPLLFIILLFAHTHWRKPEGKLLTISFIGVAVASLGPKLHIAGIETISPPWRLLIHLPFLGRVIPSRITMFVFLTIAVLTSLWLSSAETDKWTKRTLLPLALIFIFPGIVYSYTRPASFWKAKLITPAFFTTGLYKQYLCPGETTVILPYGDRGESMAWQAETGMYFRMAGGYVNWAIPMEYWNLPIVQTFYSGNPSLPDDQARLRNFLSAYGVRTIIVAPESQEAWKPLFSGSELTSTNIGGVTLYRVPNSECPR